MRARHLKPAPAADGPGNLFEPKGPAGETGGWKRVRPYALIGAVAAAGVLAVMRRRPLLHA